MRRLLAAILCAAATASAQEPYPSDIWYGLYLPAAAPRDVVQKPGGEINALLKTAAIAETLARQGLQATGGTPEQLADLTRNDLERSGRIVREAGIRADRCARRLRPRLPAPAPSPPRRGSPR